MNYAKGLAVAVVGGFVVHFTDRLLGIDFSGVNPFATLTHTFLLVACGVAISHATRTK